MVPARLRKGRRWLRFAGRALLGSVVLAMGLGAALWWFTRPEALRARLDKIVAAHPGLHLIYTDLRWVWPDAIELDDVQLEFRDPAASAHEDARVLPSLRVDKARVGGLLSELLQRKDKSQQFTLENAAIRVDLPFTPPPDGDALKTLIGVLRMKLPARWIDPRGFPTLAAERAHIELWRPAVAGERARLVERLSVGFAARHATEGAYEITLTPTEEGAAEWRLRMEPASRRVSLESAGLELMQLRELFGPQSRGVLRERVGDDARARIERLALKWPDGSESVALVDAIEEMSLEVSEIAGECPLPLELVGERRAPFVRYGQQRAKLMFDGLRDSHTIRAELTGGLRSARVEAQVELDADLLRRAVKEAPAGEFERAVRTALVKIGGLDVPTREAHPAFYDHAAAGQKVAKFFHRFRPEGVVDVELRYGLPAPEGAPIAAARDDANARPGVSGHVRIVNGGCIFRGFPYHFQNVTGDIAFAGGKTRIIELSAPAGLGRVDLWGEVFTPDDWTGVSIHAIGHNVALDRQMFAALPERYQRLWSEVQPLGFADLEVAISRPTTDEARGPSDSEINVDATVTNAGLTLNGLRRRPVSAEIRVRGGTIDIVDLWVADGNGGLSVSGEISPGGGSEAASASQPAHAAVSTTTQPVAELRPIELPSHAEDAHTGSGLAILALDYPFRSEFKLGDAGPVLRADLRTDLSLTHNDDSPKAADGPIAARVVGGTIRAGELGPAWSDVSGEVIQSAAALDIGRLEARRAQDRLELRGRVARGGEDRVDLTGTIEVADVQRALDEVLPPATRASARELGLHGAATFDLRVVGDPTGRDPKSPLNADVTLRAAGIRPVPFPLDLRDFEAKLQARGQTYELTRATARLGSNAKFEISGGGSLGPAGKSSWRGAARDVTIDAALMSALPESLRKWLQPLSPGGTLQVRIDELRPMDQGRFALRAAIEAQGGALQNANLTLSQAAGSLVGEAIIDGDGRLTGVGTLMLNAARVGECGVRDLSARLQVTGADGRIRLDDLRAQVANGTIAGKLEVSPQSSEYRCDVELAGADLPMLMSSLGKSGQTKMPAGRISGRLQLSGALDRGDTRVGEGAVVLERGVFSGTPVLDPLREAAAKRSGGGLADRIDLMQLLFVWRGDELQMKEIELSSPDLRLVGAGRWRLSNGEINMKLVGAHPRDWPRVVLLTDILEVAQQVFVQFRVRGQWEKPKVTIEPLPPVVEGLREIFSPD